MTASRIRVRKNHILRSVFQTEISQPTPVSEPTAPGESFGGPLVTATRHTRLSSSQAVADQVRWDRAWHAVTSRIQLPSSVTVEDSFGSLAPEASQNEHDASFRECLALILDPASLAPRATCTEDILLWHTQQARQHFVHHVLPLLAACSTQKDDTQVLLSSVQTLEAAHRQYLYGLTLIVRGIKDETNKGLAMANFSRDLHAVIGNSWARGLTTALRRVMSRLLAVVLGSIRDSTKSSKAKNEAQQSQTARDDLLSLIQSLINVGLAGDGFQVLFGETMDSCMKDFIRLNYAGVWTSLDLDGNVDPSDLSGCMGHLHHWVENRYGRLAAEILSRLGGQVVRTDVEKWKDIAVGRLASLRMRELFDIVLHWPQSKGGLEDLRTAVATPQRRLELTDTFSASLQKRLLHPGLSTLSILQTYISMIRTFHQLDASKVLLDRVAHALQLYLCRRDDAIRVVVIGLLSDPSRKAADDGKKELVELACLLHEASYQARTMIDDEDLDWDDMTWVPDPVDAGPNYKRPKSEDVVGTLINALGSGEIFIKEFQAIIGERLLSRQSGFRQEIKVLSLLKKKFGETALQNCDVMVRDIYDSKRLDASLLKVIRDNDHQEGQKKDQNVIKYHSKILSRLFWPSMAPESFEIPAPVANVQARYEVGFEQLKAFRKLNWLNHMGSATVQLDLKDRSMEIECKTYEAAVIYAFQADDTDHDGLDSPQKRTFNQLWERLRIDEDLLELALRFWTARRVLSHIGDQTYVVLEELNSSEQEQPAASSTLAALPSTADPTKSSFSPHRKTRAATAKEQEKRNVYWQFIMSMLTNTSPTMSLAQMAMMMKMLIADGLSWSDDELQDFLAEKVAAGELELAGAQYRLARK